MLHAITGNDHEGLCPERGGPPRPTIGAGYSGGAQHERGRD